MVESNRLAHLVALGPVSMMCYVTVRTVISVGLIGMLRTNCSGGTRLAWHSSGARMRYHNQYCQYAIVCIETVCMRQALGVTLILVVGC